MKVCNKRLNKALEVSYCDDTEEVNGSMSLDLDVFFRSKRSVIKVVV